MDKIWNYKVPYPLLWKGHYDAIVGRGDEEWVLNIEGPHHLEDICGIEVYVLMVFKDPNSCNNYKNSTITIESTNRVCVLDRNQGVCLSNSEVLVWYSNLESFELKVLDNLRVQFQIPGDAALLRMPYYRSWGANIVYKQESRAHKRRKMD
ncbi:hypothetical protein I3842_15G103000 [Carya illinoinensis]|uniref:Uncharacterized protein n=1 Tax=Carya illinoinensis TaxID=32201 RepID=A0A922A5I4_CARIL|nr:hypothetical protein I3842_15G103000 [Carya illinoinensis]